MVMGGGRGWRENEVEFNADRSIIGRYVQLPITADTNQDQWLAAERRSPTTSLNHKGYRLILANDRPP